MIIMDCEWLAARSERGEALQHVFTVLIGSVLSLQDAQDSWRLFTGHEEPGCSHWLIHVCVVCKTMWNLDSWQLTLHPDCVGHT